MTGRKRRERRTKRQRQTQNQSTATQVLAVGSTLVSVVLSLVAGIVIGGWIAFETPYWRGFRRFIEGIPIGSALYLGGVLFVGAAGIGLVVALKNHSG